MRGVGAPPRLGGLPLLSSSLEVGESSRGDVSEGVGGSLGAAIDVGFYFHTLGVSSSVLVVVYLEGAECSTV
jgi:hypothetical protein